MGFQEDNEYDNSQNTFRNIVLGAVGLSAVGLAGFLSTRVRVAKPQEYLIKTGIFVRDINVSKKTIELPFQRVTTVNMNPVTYNFDLVNMSKEKIEFRLPIVFTVQPKSPLKDSEGFINYARRMNDMSTYELEKTIGGIIEGSTRVLSSTMSVEQLFSEKDAFREQVVEKIEPDLLKLGFEIVNANVKELGDHDEQNQYFAYRKQRAVSMADYESQVDVSEAKKDGIIGVTEREGLTRQKIAAIERDAKIAENERSQAISRSNAELSVIESEAKRSAEQARVEADIKVQMRQIEMERELEEIRRERELESKRASELAPAIVAKEKTETNAQADLYRVQKDSDAKAYSVSKAAEAYLFETERHAEASLFQANKDAEAILIKAEKEATGILAKKMAEAKGILAIKEAEAEGLEKMLRAGEDPELVKFYLGLNVNLPHKIAEEQAKALQGLNPDVTIWNTTGNDGNSIGNTFGNMAQSIVPVLDAIKDKVDIPNYLPQVKNDKKNKNKK